MKAEGGSGRRAESWGKRADDGRLFMTEARGRPHARATRRSVRPSHQSAAALHTRCVRRKALLQGVQRRGQKAGTPIVRVLAVDASRRGMQTEQGGGVGKPNEHKVATRILPSLTPTMTMLLHASFVSLVASL
jgi:hypothetical protein